MPELPFDDRRAAGKALAESLLDLEGRRDVAVVALPRGGVPVAHEVARRLQAPLDVLIVRKLGLPGHRELAMGALASDGSVTVDRDLVRQFGVSDDELRRTVEQAQDEIEQRRAAYGGRRRIDLRDQVVVLVDDGLATGSTMEVAVEAARRQEPTRIIVAAPVGAPDSCARLAQLADEVRCLHQPSGFGAVGQWYRNFHQTTDDEVRRLLRSDDVQLADVEVELDAGLVLRGDLTLPAEATGIVLFAHGSGSSRHSPRNRFVAEMLRAKGLGTFLIDLLTSDEEREDRQTAALRFDIGLLADRLVALGDWLASEPSTAGLPLGLFGASTGGGAALVAAAQRPDQVAAVVSRGGRPDLAGPALGRVRAPTLLIVGGRDQEVLRMNEAAKADLDAETRLAIVSGATHLFEEPGALEEVGRLAGDWFQQHLAARSTPSVRH